MADEPTAPSQGQPQEQVQEPKQEPQAPAEVPEKLQGKDAVELAKMYVEAEKKLGEQGQEIGESRKFQEDMAVVLQAINANPEVKASVEKELRKMTGVEEKVENKEPSPIEDTRKAVEVQTIKDFQQKFGLTTLDAEQRQKVLDKVGEELVEMFDPSGTKSGEEILKSISLAKLPQALEKAYHLANLDEEIQKATREGMVKAMQNRQAAIGSIPSSGGLADTTSLTAEERQVARKLGISEEDYLLEKKELIENG